MEMSSRGGVPPRTLEWLLKSPPETFRLRWNTSRVVISSPGLVKLSLALRTSLLGW